ncbi:MAG TPA: peptidylprolyl isomerase [Nevskiales bacterium]|nr:peptidylprolyl isomerase [Nevskiales bacterium]
MPRIRISTRLGQITLSLDATKAASTTANFLEYARSGFYVGTLFHRVIPGFMIQGGGLTRGLKPKATRRPIRNEADNGLKNLRGSIAMARTSDPHSATAQFFINLKDNDFLDYRSPDARGWGYCVFGQVTEGMDVVDAIAAVETGRMGMHADVPKQDITIDQVEILED